MNILSLICHGEYSRIFRLCDIAHRSALERILEALCYRRVAAGIHQHPRVRSRRDGYYLINKPVREHLIKNFLHTEGVSIEARRLLGISDRNRTVSKNRKSAVKLRDGLTQTLYQSHRHRIRPLQHGLQYIQTYPVCNISCRRAVIAVAELLKTFLFSCVAKSN